MIAAVVDLQAAAGRGWPPSGCSARPARSRGRGRSTRSTTVTVPWKSWALPGLPSVVRLTEPLPLVLSTKAVLPSWPSATAVGKYPAWRKPRTWPGGEVDLGQGVVAAVGDVERLAAQGQRVGHAAEHAERPPAQRDRPRDLAGLEVDLADRVAHGVGDVGASAVDDDRRRVDADLDVPGRAGRAVDQADRARRRRAAIVDHDVEVLALGRPVAGPGQPAAPVADDQRPLVVREPRLERQGLDRVLADELAASSGRSRRRRCDWPRRRRAACRRG